MASSPSPSASRASRASRASAPRTPIVGVTATVARVHEDGAAAPIDAVVLDASYLHALGSAGMLAVLLPPTDPAAAERVLDTVDALVLTGGDDVHPAHYGEPPHAAAGPFGAERDAWEIALARAAHARRLPTLAICRGAQLLNVALGGSLVQHLGGGDDAACGARHDRASERRRRVHALAVAPDGPLARALGTTT